MRLDHRTVTQLGAGLLFIVLSLALIRAPAWGPALFPAYALLFLWSDQLHDNDLSVIFLFLVTAGGLVLLSRAPAAADKAAMAGAIAGVWAVSAALSAHRSLDEGRRQEIEI